VKIIPDMYDIISGQVRMESLGTPLIEIKHEIIAPWQRIAKRAFDIMSSLLLLLLFSPVFIFATLMTKFSSPGPIFYRQKRIGIHGKEFSIIKFRSMFNDAERTGPQLSSEEDDRITPWGRIMRKYRLDELPQFYNVIIGEMSIVGPRPERQFYIEQIIEKAPHYKHVQKVKPGITSWGMVKFGYAENVDEMIERLKYDLIYIENMNLLNDFKILFYTVLIVLQGRGK
jgi:exopolysaccharide biosynthesis polyprenyl glycosylphosphotransferase